MASCRVCCCCCTGFGCLLLLPLLLLLLLLLGSKLRRRRLVGRQLLRRLLEDGRHKRQHRARAGDGASLLPQEVLALQGAPSVVGISARASMATSNPSN